MEEQKYDVINRDIQTAQIQFDERKSLQMQTAEKTQKHNINDVIHGIPDPSNASEMDMF